jgi:hypothetical protein
MFERHGNGVRVTDIYRGNQPPGSAGQMLADSLRQVGLRQPSTIRISNIVNDQTIQQLQVGSTPGNTALGRATANAVQELGGRITGWTRGVENGKLWIQATVAY